MFTIAFGLRTEGLGLTFAIGPATQLSLDRRACIIVGVTFGVMIAIGTAGPTIGTRGDMASIVVGIAFGISFGTMAGLLNTAWPYFVIVRTYLLSSSDCCRLVGERESGAGKAPVDQVGAELDMTQPPAEGAFEVVVVGEGGVGQRTAP